MGDAKLHIVVFPWLAFGHILPFLELSKALAKRGHRISFLSTPRNIQRLPTVHPQLALPIDFIPLPLPPTDGLPPNAEATSDLPFDKVQYLKKAFDGLEGPFASFIEASSPKPDWIIHDFAQHWLPRVARKFGLPCIYFSVFRAATHAFLGPPSELGSRRTAEQFTVPPKWFPSSSNMVFRLHEGRQLAEGLYEAGASEASDAYRAMMTLDGCKALAPRSCKEFEPDWLSILQEIIKKPVIPVGLLPPASAQERGKDDGNNTESEVKIMEWLDQQAPRSVVYVAFGSEALLSAELVHELALGLELSKMPFLWAFRKPEGATNGIELLPGGFEERTQGHGVVVMDWVPQLKVLAHRSVGGFLTHCGWSSVIESLQYGHPHITLPIFGDQGLTARDMGDKEIGVEVQRNEEDGSFTREMVAKALRLVMVEEEGEKFRVKAKQWSAILTDGGCQESYVDGFVQYLSDHKNNEG